MLSNVQNNGYNIQFNGESRALIREERYASSEKLLDELATASSEELKEGSKDELLSQCIASCIELNDLEGMRRIAYTLFSGSRFLHYNSHLDVLAYLFLDDEGALSDIGKAIETAFGHWKEKLASSDADSDEEELSAKAARKYWNGYKDELAPNDTVFVMHGGGLRHVLDTLNRKKKSSYECDSYGYGMYVAPFQKVPEPEERSDSSLSRAASAFRGAEYANRTPLKQFDIPVVLFGEIKAKHLIRTSNGYEAVIPEGLEHKLKNPQFIFPKVSGTQLPLVRPDYIAKECFPKDSELQERISHAIGRVLRKIREEVRSSQH